MRWRRWVQIRNGRSQIVPKRDNVECCEGNCGVYSRAQPFLGGQRMHHNSVSGEAQSFGSYTLSPMFPILTVASHRIDSENSTSRALTLSRALQIPSKDSQNSSLNIVSVSVDTRSCMAFTLKCGLIPLTTLAAAEDFDPIIQFLNRNCRVKLDFSMLSSSVTINPSGPLE
eukprot:03728_5